LPLLGFCRRPTAQERARSGGQLPGPEQIRFQDERLFLILGVRFAENNPGSIARRASTGRSDWIPTRRVLALA
jgi:hypothetical protein